MTLALLVILMLLAAGGLAVGGVYLLAGVAWAMLSASLVLLALAVLLRMGMTDE